MYSGISGRKVMASTNISTGPMIQFCTSDNAMTLTLLNTLPSSSYFTLASGGYIMTIRPTAIGIDVVPTENLSSQAGMPGNR